MRMLGLVILMLLKNNRQLYFIARVAEIPKIGLIAHDPNIPTTILLLRRPVSILHCSPSSILLIRQIDLYGHVAIIQFHSIGSIEYQLFPIRSD